MVSHSGVISSGLLGVAVPIRPSLVFDPDARRSHGNSDGGNGKG
jgi:hypothetical protein